MSLPLSKRTHERLKRLESAERETVSAVQAEQEMYEILQPLLEHAGYHVGPSPQAQRDGGVDFIAYKGDSLDKARDSLGIEYKHYRQQAVGADTVHKLLGAVLTSGLSRAMLVTNARFTTAARQAIRRTMPVEMELMDPDAIRAWAARLEQVAGMDLPEVDQIRLQLSRSLIRLIADDPNALNQIEWRELERLMAEVFDGLGFDVELTPGSKDGGKDLVLTCRAMGKVHTYYVEIKHWRSGHGVGGRFVREFLNVMIREEVDGGLFLSTYGYCSNAIESITEIERQSLRLGGQEKVVSLCKTFVRAGAGIWTPSEKPSELLYAGTF